MLTPQGWRFGDFPGADRDTLDGATYVHEIYSRADRHFTGRATVPVLWDKKRRMIVNNGSADILRMLNSAFGPLADASLDLYPADLADEIDALNERLHRGLNNGVYRAGFAVTQVAYEEAFHQVFAMLDELAARLADHRYLCGDSLTESDVRAFVSLARFDVAYVGLFKCNARRIVDDPALQAYLLRMLNLPGVRETVSIAHIKRGYSSIHTLNPNGVTPLGPDIAGLTDGR